MIIDVIATLVFKVPKTSTYQKLMGGHDFYSTYDIENKRLNLFSSYCQFQGLTKDKCPKQYVYLTKRVMVK